MWICILALSQCPICLSSIYKESTLNTIDVDVVLLVANYPLYSHGLYMHSHIHM